MDATRATVPGDRLFSAVHDFLIIAAAIAHSTSLVGGGSTHTTSHPVMRVTTRWPDFGLALPMDSQILDYALRGATPSLIEIGILTDPALLSEPLPNAKIQTSGLLRTFSHIISPIFLSFFERYNVWLRATYGDDKNWHPTLNFARVIRNAVAHGAIAIRNPRSPTASWRDLSYGPNDDGKVIVGEDLKFGEILRVMFDCDDALNSIAAPVL